VSKVLQVDGKIRHIARPALSGADLFDVLAYPARPIELPSGDYLVVRIDYRTNLLGVNKFASFLAKEEVHGPAILCEPQEID
jgi:hypothetical protein